MPRNDPWTPDELILALDLYFRLPPGSASKAHPEIVALSRELNALSGTAKAKDPTRFRNPNGVYMKLCNFLRFDPAYKGKGLTHGADLEETIWRAFSGNRRLLAKTAGFIRKRIPA